MAAPKVQRIVRDLLSRAGIGINGTNPWDIQIHNDRFYERVFRNTILGLGESYMDGWWDCDSIDSLTARLLNAKLQDTIRGSWKIQLFYLRSRFFNLQKHTRSFQVGRYHYDLGNDLYRAMLDTRMNYTCGYWRNADTLDDAQEAKLELVCRKIGVHSGMRILELGCGWGSFAKYAAEKYDAEVLGVTVSKAQVELGRELCRGLPVELRLQDYRDVTGKYDAVISIGIMEHVGYRNYRTYMKVTDRCLKDDGVAFIHTIGGNRTTTSANPWTVKYIFPNGMLPSIAQLGSAMEGLFVMEDLHNIGPDYDKTLLAWYNNFESAWDSLQRTYDERFRRMWRFYLLSSAGGFRSRSTQLWQIVMTKPGVPQPTCRVV
jgi:cyclopropane-fatty-acyl-phospholipid synthase